MTAHSLQALSSLAVSQKSTTTRFAVAQAGSGDEVLAIGQKVACYTGTRHLVNIVSGGGWYGFDGITQMCRAMEFAAETVTDTEKIIQLKGWGCDSCL